MEIGSVFLESSVKRVSTYRDLCEKAMQQLTDEDFYFQPHQESNSIALIIQHMSGNMISRWTNFLSEDGEKSWRDRDLEFTDQKLNRETLLNIWAKGWDRFIGTLKLLGPGDLLKTIYIRTEPILVLDAINRQLTHYPYHAGQIIFIAKMIKGKDWLSLTIPLGESAKFNRESGLKY